MLEPVGRLSPGVYWRRRAIVLAVALAVLAVAGWAAAAASGLRSTPGAQAPGALSADRSAAGVAPVSSHGATTTAPPPALTVTPSVEASSTGQPTAARSSMPQSSMRHGGPTPQTSPSQTLTPDATTPQTPTASGSAPAAPATLAPVAQRTPAPAAICSPADLALNVGVDQPKYRVGDQPGIVLDLVNVSSATCTGDFGPANQDVKVYARSNRLWSSNDCHRSDDHIAATLRPGEHFRYTVAWAGYTSLPGCAPSHILVGAGVYQAYGVVDGLRASVQLEMWPAESADPIE